MDAFVLTLLLLVGVGIAAAALAPFSKLANFVGTWGTVAALVPALVLVVGVVATGEGTATLIIPWGLPIGKFHIELDTLSAWFALPVILVSALTAIFAGQWSAQQSARFRRGVMWLCFNVLVMGMLLTLVARNSLLFLIAYELMSVTMYFLVVWFDERPGTVSTGQTYLIAAHLGVACLFPVMLILGGPGPDLEFVKLPLETGSFRLADALFLLAIAGFGAKAGIFPFHVWMPDTYGAAPAYVPALSSGAMGKVAIYGLIRVILLLGTPPVWWAWVLIGLGGLSGAGGLMIAQSQQNLKRLLAYSSSENVGMIFLGLGVGLLGMTMESPQAAALGFGGALFHVWNHALYKTLLFMGVGAIEQQTGTTNLNQLGGLMQRVPLLSCCFALGCLAITGLPPLNGFTSEFLILLGGFSEEVVQNTSGNIPALAVIAAIAFIAGLSISCFSQVCGIGLLGSPRSPAAANIQPPGWQAMFPIITLCVLCVVVSLASPRLLPLIKPVLILIEAGAADDLTEQVELALQPVKSVNRVMFFLLFMIGLMTAVRYLLLVNRKVSTSGTWDCGYAQPTARMQYTGSSFAEAQGVFYDPLLATQTTVIAPEGLFPKNGQLLVETKDVFLQLIYQPLFRFVGNTLAKLSWLQQGRVHIYVLYIALTLVGLLTWYLGGAL